MLPRLRLATTPPRIVLDQRSREEGFFSFGAVRRVPFFVTPMVGFTETSIVHGSGESFEYQVYAMDGKLSRTVRLAAPAQTITRADVQRARDALNASTRDPAEARKLVAAMDAMTLPSTHPAYDRIVAESDGVVWLRAYSPDSSRAESWVRFDPLGNLEGTLAIPAGWRAIGFSGSRVVLREDDAITGLQRLKVHAIDRLHRE
ncbi:MAG TPA: hypothetical protein VMM18_02305 [Gemmatimonadaceae bacterium]|nr:hypothetical protein [Gemmatimonadaceae bacterium]